MEDRPSPQIAAIVVAAGQGLRAGQPLPKQFALWRGKPVVRHSVEALAAQGIAPIVVAIPDGGDEAAALALAGIAGVRLITGGTTRQQSVRLALEALAGDGPALVLIHDAARPNLRAGVIERLLGALQVHDAAIPVLPVADSLAHAEGELMGAPARREDLRRVQTPQAFKFAAILKAHRAWMEEPLAGDDAQVAQAAGLAVALVEGDEALHKLTYATDFAADRPAMRIGTGFDVHRLAEGEELWLCGILIPHSHGLAGHSDADVAIHALVDAILGALGMATSAAISRQATHSGAGPRPTGSWRTPSAARPKRAMPWAMPTSRSSARRQRSARIAKPCASALPRLPEFPPT